MVFHPFIFPSRQTAKLVAGLTIANSTAPRASIRNKSVNLERFALERFELGCWS